MDLYPTTRDHVFTNEDIDTILHTITQIKPEDITSLDESPVIGEYDFAQARQAIAQRAVQLAIHSSFLARSQEKFLVGGKELRVHVSYPLSGDTTLPQTVELSSLYNHEYILEYEFPILDPTRFEITSNIRFSDFRQNPYKFTYFSDMVEKGATLEDVRQMWQGLRWMCANLREWNNLTDIIWPEEI